MRKPFAVALSGLLLLGAARPPADRASLEARLTAKEQQLASLFADFWRKDYAVALGKKNASTLPIRARIREVLTEPRFLEELRQSTFSDRPAERRRRLFLDEAAESLISSDPELSTLNEKMDRDFTAARFEVEGKRLARAELNTLIAQDPDRGKRRQAWEARAQMAPIAADNVRRAMALRQRLAQRFAGGPFPDFMLKRNQVDREKMLVWFEEIRRETEAEFERLCERMRAELGVATLEPWDLDYFFAKMAGESVDRALGRDQAWSRIEALTKSLGLDVGRLPIELRVSHIAFGGGTYPIRYGKEVRILVNAYTGLSFTDTLLHETGHALHYCLDAELTFLLQSNYAQPLDEGLGQTMSLMLYRPEVGTKFFGLSAEEVRRMAEAYRLGSLFDLRQRIASSLFEFEAYADPTQDLTALYDRTFRKYLGVSTHGKPVWAFNPFYATGPIYLQSYVLAEMVARQLHAALDRRFGRTWGPEAGAFLREKFFSRGGTLTLDEILQDGTGEPLSTGALIAALKESPPAEPAGRVSIAPAPQRAARRDMAMSFIQTSRGGS